MNTVSLHPLTEADLEEVVVVERLSFQHPWNRDHILNEIQSPHSFPLLARSAEGVCVGYICPTLVLDEGQILNVAVHPSFRGKGIGKLLVRSALEEFEKKGASVVLLEVRPSNTAALSLYRLLGFVATGRRSRYYENGEDAILMSFEMKNWKEGSHAV